MIQRFMAGDLIAINDNNKIKIFEKLRENQVIKTHWINKKYHGYHFGAKLVDSLLENKTFDFPKSLYLIIDILKITTKEDDIILDFFSGSSTTAHAVMQLNTEDKSNRKFIMVQLPETIDEGSEAYKAGYKLIPEIAKERIRRASKKIQEENKDKDLSNIDFGFKVFKLDSSNMEDIYYNPKAINQKTLTDLESNIKEDRTEEDLLYQILLDLAIPISAKVKEEQIKNKKVFKVNDNFLFACFENEVTLELVKELATESPFRLVFKDSSFKNDTEKINIEEYLKHQLPNTIVRVI
ncbi:MAG: site-specific DNA-methyltransferase, partial [Nanoarchaeota archaeon]|nr:site-specific DNA-methyltransferase [Nanoarchaeota archaeon]